MIKDTKTYQVLLIEDNPGDVLLIEEYIKEFIRNPTILHFDNFDGARDLLSNGSQQLDVILLDLTLPNIQGEELILAMMEIANDIPVLVLTGFADMAFSVRSLELGVSDYLLKDDLTGFSLYKAIIHNINRKRYIQELKQSEKRYNELFHHSPQPTWVFDLETLDILDANIAMEKKYKYSMDELLQLNVRDLIPEHGMQHFESSISKVRTSNLAYGSSRGQHKKKNGELFDVEIHGNMINFGGKICRIVSVNDLTEINQKSQAIELQNKRLKEIAWTQSHLVRAPLSRMMGLMDLLDYEEISDAEKTFCLKELRKSAYELDEIVHKIVKKSESIEFDQAYEHGDRDR